MSDIITLLHFRQLKTGDDTAPRISKDELNELVRLRIFHLTKPLPYEVWKCHCCGQRSENIYKLFTVEVCILCGRNAGIIDECTNYEGV